MEFIASRDAVLFLAQSAPAAWVYRALLWMVQSGELNLYADRVEVAARSSVFDFVAPLNEEAGEWSGSAMDAAIRRKYPAELAEKLVGKDTHDEIEDESQIVEGWDSIGALDIGFLIYYSKFDWSKGLMECDYIDNDLLRTDWLFSSQEFVWSDFLNPTYSVKFEGLNVDRHRRGPRD